MSGISALLASPLMRASRPQSRLLLRLWKECASFVLSARSSIRLSDSASDTIRMDALMDLFKSLSFEPIIDYDDQGGTHTNSYQQPNQGALPSFSLFSTSSTSVVPLVATRVALPDSLHLVPMENVLPASMISTYSSPAQLLRPIPEVALLNLTEPLKPPRVAGLRSEYVKLVARMLSIGMLSFTSQPKAVNGVFTVGKDADFDRLIIDAQPANRLFRDPPGVTLPNPSHLVQLRLEPGSRMFVGKSDFSNYYHHVKLMDWLRDYFALPALTRDEWNSIGVDHGESVETFYPVCLSMPMGWSYAVVIGQAIHEHIVYSSGVLSPEDNIVQLSSPEVTTKRVLHGIILDDSFFFSRSRSLARRIFARVLDTYRQAGFIVQPSKVIQPTLEPVKVLGCVIQSAAEQHTTVGLSIEAKVELAQLTLTVLRRGCITGIHLAQLIGRWTWCMLVRRSSLAVLQHTYRFIETADRRRFTIWPSVRRELWNLLGLLPLLDARLDVLIHPRVIASDASEHGAGVVCSTITPSMSNYIWQLCSSKANATLQTLANAKARQLGLSLPDYMDHSLEAASTLSSAIARSSIEAACQTFASYESFYRSVMQPRWSTIISSPWRDSSEHINVLELRAVLLALHWLLSYPSSHSSRVYLLIDSTVTLFSLWKGRTSSAPLLFVLRKISALLLVSGITLLTGWVPSAVNPADGPSRLSSHDHDDE